MKIYIVDSYQEKKDLEKEIENKEGINIVETVDEFERDLKRFYVYMFIFFIVLLIILKII